MISALTAPRRYVKASVLILVFFSSDILSAQPTDTVLLTRKQAEKIFLDKNIQLLAGKLNIQQAEARIIQARLWPNPRLTIDEVNLWATPAQLSMGEELPALFNNGFGKNQQISAQLEQTLITAGKRRKLIAIEQVGRDMAVAYFEELVRNLKIEFRNLLTELQYLQSYQEVFARQIPEARKLLAAYERLAPMGNINRADVVRLKALVLELHDEYNELHKQTNAVQKELTVLLGFSPDSYIRMSSDDFVPDPEAYETLPLPELIQRALTGRPDLLLAQLESKHAGNTLTYELAGRVPDVTVSAGYDRGGNFMYNFLGFGVGLDIPVFHRNQGHIKAARIAAEKASLWEQNQTRRVEAEVIEAYRNLNASINLYQQIEQDYEAELDHLLSGYTRNFRERNVSMLEFLDFMEAFLENKKIILNAKKSLNRAIEELAYAVGIRGEG
jgi:cobalt-zinc-cadmium efflux system outer membrane protein